MSGAGEALSVLSHETLARVAADLIERVLAPPAECHYCGVKPGQDTPRPSYYDMRTLLAQVSKANSDGEGGHESLWDAVDAMVAYFDGSTDA